MPANDDSISRCFDASNNIGAVQMEHQDVAFVNLHESYLGIVQVGAEQLILGSGRYIIANSAVLRGCVNIHNLQKFHTVTVVTEESETKDGKQLDVTREKVLLAGTSQCVAGVTFVRSSPGFCYVIEGSNGRLRSGIGVGICRGTDKFIDFVDRQHYGRTTRPFLLESKDRHQVSVRVQLRWRLQNAKQWIKKCHASGLEDVFDGIEEKCEAYLRNALAGLSHEECASQAAAGYDGVEGSVNDALEQAVRSLGGKLLGFEIRELKFPQLDQYNKDLANREAENSNKLQKVKNQAKLEAEWHKKGHDKQKYQQDVAAQQVEHDAKMQELQNLYQLELTKSNNIYNQKRDEFALQKEELLLRASQEQQKVRNEIKEAQAAATAAIQLLDAERNAAIIAEQARAESECIRAAAQAQADSKQGLAAADAEAAQLIGAAYKTNPQYLTLQLEKVKHQMLRVRSEAMKAALNTNPTAFMPVELQREMAFLRANISPISPVILPGTGVVTMDTDGRKMNPRHR